jgi:hypothetical protein
MKPGHQRLISTLGAGVATAMLTGCGPVTQVTLAIKPPDRAVALAARGPLALEPDVRACAGVQGVIGHLTSSTAGWSPNLNPFDKAISTQIRLLSGDLDKQAPQAQTPHIRQVVHANALAFAALADAMVRKDNTGVIHAIGGTKTAFRELKKVCLLTSDTGTQ